MVLVLLAADGGALDEADLTTGLAGEGVTARTTWNHGGGVAVHSRDGIALGALAVDEEGVGALHEASTLVLEALNTDGGVCEIGVEETHGWLALFKVKEEEEGEI